MVYVGGFSGLTEKFPTLKFKKIYDLKIKFHIKILTLFLWLMGKMLENRKKKTKFGENMD